VQLYLIQRYRKREQNHQACLNVMPSAALSYLKISQRYQACNVMPSAAESSNSAKIHQAHGKAK
jgi:hypothetical protein